MNFANFEAEIKSQVIQDVNLASNALAPCKIQLELYQESSKRKDHKS